SYNDHPLGIGHNQTISQPYIVAYMIDKLAIQKTDKVLEIGTGSGYQTAILAELAKEVYTLEIIKPLQIKAKKILINLNYNNIIFGQHSGYLGWKEYAPFDKIIVSAAARTIPEKLVEQLCEGGLMIIPIGHHFSQTLYLIKKKENSFKKEKLDLVRFVPMVEK
ncbi:MAG: protein-L-isoaspartate(D-aspartate) O-methyltransferase, partial [Bacillota bacterium]